MKTTISERVFHFKQPAGTSRGIYTERRSWLVKIADGGRCGVGECAPLPSLSCDDLPNYADILAHFCRQLERTGELDAEALRPYPSMRFGLETALLSLQRGQRLFDTPFARGEEGIPINGLVWMGTQQEMLGRMEEKLAQGYGCIKLKIGAIDFADELALLRRIRAHHSAAEVEIRVDANGAFATGEAFERLVQLSQLDLHSIEQPIAAGQWGDMAELCREAPLPIALDEELIGVNDRATKAHLLDVVKPAYIVLKPSLHGGMGGCREWIELARERRIGSWITSALESNVGLNAIAQFAAHVYGSHIHTPQGLGTGQLFTDNIDMPLAVRHCQLWTGATTPPPA